MQKATDPEKLVFIGSDGVHGGWLHNQPECIVALRLQGFNDELREPRDPRGVAEVALKDKWLCEGCGKRLVPRV